MFSKQLKVGLKLQASGKEFFLALLVYLVVFNIITVIVVQSTFAIPTITAGNKTNGSANSITNMTIGNIMSRKNMTMPGGNMTFGSSLQNAKMHLTEAIMDLKIGDSKGVAMELNLTAQAVKMHEQELKIMMMQVKNMMANMN